jgi:hypothetical protein
MAQDKPKVETGFRDKLGPLPPETFDNDFPPRKAPKKGDDPAFDELRDHVEANKPKRKSLTPREEQLLAEVMAATPTLSREEAIRQLRAAGM